MLSLGEHQIHRNPEDGAGRIVRDLDEAASLGIVHTEDLAGENLTEEVVANSHCFYLLFFFCQRVKAIFDTYCLSLRMVSATVGRMANSNLLTPLTL